MSCDKLYTVFQEFVSINNNDTCFVNYMRALSYQQVTFFLVWQRFDTYAFA